MIQDVSETNSGELPEVSGGLDLQLVLIWFDSKLACEFGDRKNLDPDLDNYIHTYTYNIYIYMVYIIHMLHIAKQLGLLL